MRTRIKTHPKIKRIALAAIRSFGLLRKPITMFRFLGGWIRFLGAGGDAFPLDFYPCLDDNTSETAIDYHAFYQPIWLLKHVLKNQPNRHVDIGSQVTTAGMLSAICPVDFVDIRPVPIATERFKSQAGSILDLPYSAKSLESVSSLHVLEHVGLGRYGDPIQANGPELAAKELVRALAPYGRLYVTTPIGRPKVSFNAHRIFSVAEILNMFRGLDCVEFSVVDFLGKYREAVSKYILPELLQQVSGNDFCLGMFVFRRMT